MKKLYSLLLLAALTAVFFLFNGYYPVEQNTWGDDPTKDPNYATIKMNFYEAYNKYVADKLKGIDAIKPVDPSGYFDIDEMGRVNLAYKYRHPQIPQDGTNNNGNLPKVTQEFANKQGETNGIIPHGGVRDAVST